jgi:undecaprenyl-diphosphatase
MILAGVVGLDRRLERWIVHHRTGWLDPVFVWLTRIGSYGAIWLALALVLALVLRRPRVFLLVLAADAVAEAAADILKVAIGRRRPPLVYPHPAPLVHDPSSHAFPSGHAATSFACATTLSLLFPRALPGFLVLAAAIAFSRVYVGVHWPGDVLAGAALGVVTALLLRAAIRSRSSRARRAG